MLPATTNGQLRNWQNTDKIFQLTNRTKFKILAMIINVQQIELMRNLEDVITVYQRALSHTKLFQ